MDRLMAECLKERKEYECYAMIKKPGETPPPSIIIMPTGR